MNVMSQIPIKTFEIAGHAIGPGQPALVIAEIAQAHDGSLGVAHALVDVVARSGADAVKFQTHIAAAESSLDEPWRVEFSHQDASRYDYWQRMEFSEDQWRDLKRHAEDCGLIFISSPFSTAAVRLLERLDVPAWKIASGEINNPLLLERIAESGRPVLLSSGMSSEVELANAVGLLQRQRVPVGLFQCTTAYPCPPEQLGLDRIAAWKDRFGCPVGLSDHSGTIYAGLAAIALGADLLEVHVTLSRDMFGPDVPASVTGEQLEQLVAGCRFIERALANPADKDSLADSLREVRQIFGKRLVAARDLPRGTVLQRDHLDARKPGLGIPVDRYFDLLGRQLLRDVVAGEPLSEADLSH
jgi:N,N'-diacetyllegionaminate synthase